MKEILNQLFEHQQLTAQQAREVLIKISEKAYHEAEIASFITVYLMRDITVEELSGFREALLALCKPIDFGGRQTIDLCGTGGDGKNTFNISTLASFVTAGAGYQVTKHGNYGVSSVCGSSNVLEYLGYKFTSDTDELHRQLDKSNICFLHAPMFHPAMASVGLIRKQLRVKTFFNMLGPLVNPAKPTHQSVGVFSIKLARLYQYLHQNLDKKYTIMHSLDGYDEISLTGNAMVISNEGSAILSPEDFQSTKLEPTDIYGGETIDSSARVFVDILDGKGSKSQNQVVIANAAMAIKTFKPKQSIADCMEEARESLLSKKALQTLKKIIS